MSQTTDAVIAELMDRRLLNDVDDGLQQEIAEAVIKAAQPAVDEDGPLSTRDLAMIDQAWENHKAALPVATVINDNQPGRTAIIEITIDPPTLPVGTKLYAGPKMVDRIDVKAEAEAVAVQERKWKQPVKTVADLVNNLMTIDQTMDVHTAYFITYGDGRKETRTRSPSLSRERVANSRINNGDEAVPYSLVIWTSQDERPTTKPEAPAVSVEQLARTIATAKGVNPDCLHQNYGDEPVDHEDARGRTFHYGWRNQMHIAMPVAALIAGDR